MAKNPEVVAWLDGIVREKGYLYYLYNVDGRLALARSKVTRHGKEV